MKTKRDIFIIILFLLTLNLFSQVNAVSILKIVVDEITPLPVEPGQDMTIKVRIENIGDSSAENIQVERIYDFPFRLEYQLQEEVKIGNLAPGNSKELTFYLSVSPKAKTGVYPIKFNIKNGVSVSQEEILINIVGKPDIIFNVNSMKKNIIPNEIFETNINLNNIGTGNARNIKIISDFENFAFKDSSLIYLDNLKSGESINLSLEMIIDSSVKAGLYQIPINIEMIGEDGKIYISSQKLNINVVNSAQISLKDIKIKPLGQIVGNPTSVEVRVENIGYGSADNVYVELKFQSQDITGNKKAYIGHLDKTDESPAFFNLNSKVSGKFPAKILIHYTDDLGEHIVEDNINISYKEDNSINYFLYTGVIIILVIIFIFIKRKRK